MRLHPDTRGRCNQGTALISTTEALGDPRRPKGNLAHGRRQHRCHASKTTHTTPWRLCTALHQATALSSVMPLHHRRCAGGAGNAAVSSHPARTTRNMEPSGITVATGGPGSGHCGASEHRKRRRRPRCIGVGGLHSNSTVSYRIAGFVFLRVCLSKLPALACVAPVPIPCPVSYTHLTLPTKA